MTAGEITSIFKAVVFTVRRMYTFRIDLHIYLSVYVRVSCINCVTNHTCTRNKSRLRSPVSRLTQTRPINLSLNFPTRLLALLIKVTAFYDPIRLLVIKITIHIDQVEAISIFSASPSLLTFLLYELFFNGISKTNRSAL